MFWCINNFNRVVRRSNIGYFNGALFIIESKTLNLQFVYSVPYITSIINMFSNQLGSPVTLFVPLWNSAYIFKIQEPQNYGMSSNLTSKLNYTVFEFKDIFS